MEELQEAVKKGLPVGDIALKAVAMVLGLSEDTIKSAKGSWGHMGGDSMAAWSLSEELEDKAGI